MLNDQQQYRYMAGDDIKSMADDSMRLNVTDDEKDNRYSGGKPFRLVPKKYNSIWIFQAIHSYFDRHFIS